MSRPKPSRTRSGGLGMVADLSDLDAITGLDLDVDIVVNNAGVQHVAPLESFPPEDFSFMLKVMLEAPFRIIRGALAHRSEEHTAELQLRQYLGCRLLLEKKSLPRAFLHTPKCFATRRFAPCAMRSC